MIYKPRDYIVYVDGKRYDGVKEIEITKTSYEKRIPEKQWHAFQRFYKSITGETPVFMYEEVTLTFNDESHFSFYPSKYFKEDRVFWFESEQNEV